MKFITLTLISFLFCFSTVTGQASWEQRASFPGDARHHPVGFGIGDYGYILTGTNASNQQLSDFYRYDPAEDEWEQLDDFPGPARGFAIGMSYDGKGYIGFGLDENDDALNDIWRYDPEVDEWEELTVCECQGRRHPTLEVNNGRIFVGLGDNLFSDLRDWWVYDIEEDEWEQSEFLPASTRHHPYHFSIGDYTYTGMGHGGQVIYDDWFRFDPENQEWTEMSEFPDQARVAGTQFAYDGFGYVLSGDGANHGTLSTGEFWQYNPDTDTWMEMPPHPGVSRWAPTAFLVNGEVFFTGGLNRQTGIMINDLHSFPLHQVSSIDESEIQDVTVYPNPASEYLKLSGDLQVNKIEIVNMTGQTVQTAAEYNGGVNVSSLPNGMYEIRIQDADGVFYRSRFVKSD